MKQVPRKFASGWGVDKRLGRSNLEQTKQSHTHKALKICRGSPASPPCSPENALCTGQHCHADRHTHARPKNSREPLERREVSSLVQGISTGRPSVGRTPQARETLPGAGGNSVTSQEARAVTAPCGKGEGMQRSPQPRSLYAPPPPKSPKRPYLPRRRLHDAEGTINPPPTPRRRRLKDCEREEGWRKGGGPASQGARLGVKGEPAEDEESPRRLRGRLAAGALGSQRV